MLKFLASILQPKNIIRPSDLYFNVYVHGCENSWKNLALWFNGTNTIVYIGIW